MNMQVVLPQNRTVQVFLLDIFRIRNVQDLVVISSDLISIPLTIQKFTSTKDDQVLNHLLLPVTL